MIRLSVLYNIPADTDEDSYVSWRLSAHQQYIQSMPGVVHSDFCRITDNWPAETTLNYRFMSTTDWPDRESFERAFFNDKAQADLRENLKKLGAYTFVVSELLSP